MSAFVTCLCGAMLRVKDDKVGQTKTCPSCKKSVVLISAQVDQVGFETIFIFATKVSTKGKARWVLPSGFDGFVEEIALHSFEDREWQGIWGEGDIWSVLMALLYWDVMFAQLDGVWDPMFGEFPSAYQDMPHDFHSQEFYERRRELILERNEYLMQSDVWLELMNSHHQNYGKRCRPIYNWDRFSIEQLVDVSCALTKPALFQIMNRLLQCFGKNRSGLPDLFLWKHGRPAFAEVKGPRDRLSDAQREWLSFLGGIGIRCYLLNVREFGSNPQSR